MALAKENFVDGDVATFAQALIVEVDLEKTGSWTEMCLTNAGESPNIQIETIFEICKNGGSTTLVKGFDPEFPMEGLIRKGDVSAEMWTGRYDIKVLYGCPLRITNTLLDEQLTAIITLTDMQMEGAAEDLMKISFVGKPDGLPVVVTPIPAEA